MKKLSVLILFSAALAIAQVPTISNELFPQFRTDLNTSLSLAASTGGSYNNPAWITALAWSKITGVPSFLAPANNLSDLASISAARTNLGLGPLAIAAYPSAGLVKSNGAAFAAAAYGDIFAMFAGCSGTQYPGADGNCHTSATGGLADPGSNGLLFRSSLNATRVAAYGDIFGLFGSCSAAQFAGFDGFCHTALVAANNLSDVVNAATARTNLGLGALALAGYPSAGLFKSTGSAFSPAVIGDIPTGYPYANLSSPPAIPAASGATPLMDSTGAAGSAATFARADHVHPSDSSKQNTITSAPGSWPTSFPPWTITTGSAPPTQGVGCSLPTGTNVVGFIDTTHPNQALWVSIAASGNCWINLLSTTGLSPFVLTGMAAPLTSGLAASIPACSSASYYLATDTHALTYCDGTANSATLNSSGHQACIMNSTADAFQCYDPSGVQTNSAGGLGDPGSNGLVKRTSLNTTTAAVAGTDYAAADVPSLTSTSGPVSDPGGASYYQYNNASGALTFTLPAGVAGMQRCYRNATGKSGVITIGVITSNTIDLAGVNGTTTTGTLVSGGALGDEACLRSDAANHWMADTPKGSWTNN
jgi:hypothetical protein